MPTTLIQQKPDFSKKVEGEDKLAIAEMFCDTIQGEGITAGVPATFIRLQGCTLQCVWCFYEGTPIVKREGKALIKDIKTGDIILTLDEKNNLVETTVQEVLIREALVEDLIRLEFDNISDRPIFCTKEHPFYVKGKGWIQASRLQEKDIVIGPTTQETIKYKAHKNNNQYKSQNLEKRKQTQQILRDKGIIKPYLRSDEHRLVQRDHKLGNKNPMKDPEVSRKNAENHFKKRSSLEKKLENFCIRNKLPIIYIGNNKKAIGDKDSRYRFPDFIVDGKNKLIECYDTTMNYVVDYKNNIRSKRGAEWIELTSSHYNKFGYDVLFITEQDLKNKEELHTKLFEYIYNGSTLTKKSGLDSRQISRLFGSKDKKTIPVYNLSCYPYNTYLIHGKYSHKWVHNCDTLDVWPHGNEYSFDEIFQLMESVDLIKRFEGGQQHLVLTGGSPLKQQKQLARFLSQFRRRYGFNPYIEVENEAVLLPDHSFAIFVDQWNNSPKLANSGMKERVRIKPEVLEVMNDGFRNSWFKFVIQKEEEWQEIKTDFLPYIDRSRIILMPEGQTQQELLKTREIVANIAIREGVRFTDRLHVTIWNKKTGV